MSTTNPSDFELLFYDDNIAWLIDNDLFMESFRQTFILVWCWLIPLAAYGTYRWYWWSLSKNIYVPPRY